MSGIFLSYRREDSANDAAVIYERLTERFGEEAVFLDVRNIELGDDFLVAIEHALSEASYILIAIGPRWLVLTDQEGRQRLAQPDDVVRFEVRTALNTNKRVVPMLVGGATMPRPGELPGDIRKLVRRNGIAIRPAPDFEADVAALLGGLRVDSIDAGRVPLAFRVGLVAKDLGLGGGIGWTVLGIVAAMISGQTNAWVALPVAGAVSGASSGALVGWLTGLLIRFRSPPLVRRSVFRMGLIWSLGLSAAIVLAVYAGLYMAEDAIDQMIASAEGFGESVAALLGGFIVGLFLVVLALIAGIVGGAVLAAVFFARHFRLRSTQISRKRALVIGLVWLLGSVLAAVGFFGVAGLFPS